MNKGSSLTALQDFNKKRNALVDELSGLPDEVLNARPIEKKWSIIEIVEHMVVAEREVMMGLPESDDVVPRIRSFRNKLAYPLVMLILGRVNVKVPSRTMIPKGKTDLAKLREMWDENQQWLESYIASCDEKALDNAVFVHPVAGPMNVGQASKMAIRHFETHEKQIRERLALVNG